MKLAILLLCHKNPTQINLFIKFMKNKNIYFFIHVDKKSNISPQIIRGNNIFLLPDELRVDVKWAEYSQIEASLKLMQFAQTVNYFDYYWICSGQDFPIKSVDEILTFFDNNKPYNFIRFINSKNYRIVLKKIIMTKEMYYIIQMK